MLRNFLFLMLLLCGRVCLAQEGVVTIEQDSSIAHVLLLYKTFATEKRQVNGYRVQLASGNSRQTLVDMKAKFLQKYPEMGAYLEYQSPQFKLRVGDFRSRQEADAFVSEARKIFSAAFVVPDRVIVEGVQW